jgi:beta-lactam-binding protein with PASTA domain
VALPGAASDQVVGQNPPANSTNVSAPKVSLLVSQGDSPAAFVMPSFLGQPLGTVTNTLHDAGFSVGRVTMMQPISPPASAVPNGNPSAQQETTAPGPLIATSPSPASIIVSQDPPPGAKVVAGSAISFVVK